MNQTPVLKQYPTIGVCGLDCGLCPRYYTKGPSRCPGCAGPDFSQKHPSCSFITCCVKKKNLEVCAECAEYPCPKFKSEKEYLQVKESSSYPSYKKVIPNLNFIKDQGIKNFIQQQEKRMQFLETMMKDFDDGRSRGFFCKSAVLLDLVDLEKSLHKATQRMKSDNVKSTDRKRKAKLLRQILTEVGTRTHVNLN